MLMMVKMMMMIMEKMGMMMVRMAVMVMTVIEETRRVRGQGQRR